LFADQRRKWSAGLHSKWVDPSALVIKLQSQERAGAHQRSKFEALSSAIWTTFEGFVEYALNHEFHLIAAILAPAIAVASANKDAMMLHRFRLT
jgi:hypothetical protein